MNRYRIITDQELADYAAAIERYAWRTEDFDLQEDVFDPRTAEVETALGEVGVHCRATEAVHVYRLGPGFEWADDIRRRSATWEIRPQGRICDARRNLRRLVWVKVGPQRPAGYPDVVAGNGSAGAPASASAVVASSSHTLPRPMPFASASSRAVAVNSSGG